MHINEVTRQVIAAAMKVHSTLGPGLLETTYEACTQHELRKAGLKVQAQVQLPVTYDGLKLDLGYRIDLLLEDLVIVELKAVDTFNAVHEAQLISYLKLSGKNVGLLINFNVAHLRDGIRRIVVGRGWDRPLCTSVSSVVKDCAVVKN